MEKDKLIFSSEKEKNNYIKYINDKYNRSKTHPFGDVIRDIKNRWNNAKENGMSEKAQFILLLLDVAWIVLRLTTGLHPILNTLGSLINLEFVWGINKLYRGIMPSILLTIPSFIFYSCKRIVEKAKCLTKIFNISKNSQVVKENYEDRKLEKEEIVDSLLEDANVYNNKHVDSVLDDNLTIIKNLKETIPNINNEMMRESYIDSLLSICSILERATKLENKNNREEAFSFIYEQLGILKNNVETETKFEEQKEKLNYKLMNEVNPKEDKEPITSCATGKVYRKEYS